MGQSQVINLGTHPKASRGIKKQFRSLEAKPTGLFRTASQAGAYVEMHAAKLPGQEVDGIDSWIVTRDLVAMTYQHYDDRLQLDNLMIALSRALRLTAEVAGKVAAGEFRGTTMTVEVEITDQLARLAFVSDSQVDIYLFARFEDTYVPIDQSSSKA
ncbi:hypothetical protein [Croceicoccus gelatinilyticus]|uniref:hypothetical protein n=1 Tax=Croceicoccus gelatinilyticus TaxID=2835536 RepID=UPI001BCDBCD5|nr:hypothetical protein [Croceicoccus gelatinilyticus]MBS7671679.1 hypothetical protein [Croceicoccus gelatinilyticus]